MPIYMIIDIIAVFDFLMKLDRRAKKGPKRDLLTELQCVQCAEPGRGTDFRSDIHASRRVQLLRAVLFYPCSV